MILFTQIKRILKFMRKHKGPQISKAEGAKLVASPYLISSYTTEP